MILLLLAWPACTFAAEGGVGFETIDVPNGSEPPLRAAVWHPTSAVPSSQALGGFVQEVALDAPIRRGRTLPLVVLSHGGGGSYAAHYDTALALARAGFVVAAVSHAGDTYDDQSRVLELWRRPAQLSRLVTFMLGGWRGRDRIDPKRIGAFGFSKGGFTVLVAGGAIPDISQIDTYCMTNPSHDLCLTLKEAGISSVSAIQPPADAWRPDSRIRAIVSAAPAFGFAFDTSSLRRVAIPVQLWGAENDRHQPAPWYEQHIRDRLPHAPDYHEVPRAGHYSFLPPCNTALAQTAPGICSDAPEFDRGAFHRDFNAAVIRFFNAHLR